MDSQALFEHLFRAVVTIGVSLVIYILKDFKADFKLLTEKMAEVSTSLQNAINDTKHQREKLAEYKSRLEINEKLIYELRERILKLELNQEKKE